MVNLPFSVLATYVLGTLGYIGKLCGDLATLIDLIKKDTEAKPGTKKSRYERARSYFNLQKIMRKTRN